MKKILKISCNTWENASHDKRELSVCRELGADVAVLAKGRNQDKGRQEYVDGYLVYRYTTKPLKTIAIINKVLSLVLWALFIKKIEPNIISGHDIDGLFIGWLSNCFIPRNRRAILIYDSHEFELERNVKRGKIQKILIKRLEKFLMNKCAFSIMVNDEIANEVQKIHKLKERPIVVRNTPSYWNINEEECLKKKKQLKKELGIEDNSDSIIVLYHGVLMRDRGIEQIIRLISINTKIKAVILGNGQENYVQNLKELVNELGVGESVLFKSAIPIEELWKYVGAADIGMILAPAICKNHLYSLPNKFFENIQSETPIICPNYPSMGNIVNQYKIGLTCDPLDLSQINQCVEKLRLDKQLYTSCKKNIKEAKTVFCWEKEKNTLMEKYERIL